MTQGIIRVFLAVFFAIIFLSMPVSDILPYWIARTLQGLVVAGWGAWGITYLWREIAR